LERGEKGQRESEADFGMKKTREQGDLGEKAQENKRD
jgi:hypothetical protein